MTTVQALEKLAVEARNRAAFYEARAGLAESKKTEADPDKRRRIGHAADAKAYLDAAAVIDECLAAFGGRKSA